MARSYLDAIAIMHAQYYIFLWLIKFLFFELFLQYSLTWFFYEVLLIELSSFKSYDFE